MVTIRRYWSLEGEVGRRSSSKRSQLGVFGAVRHMGRLDYFGIGPHASFDDRSVVPSARDDVRHARLVPVDSCRAVGGSVAVYMPDLGRGREPISPFDRRGLPGIGRARGFSAEPTFGRYRGFAEFLYPVARDPDSARRNGQLSRRLSGRVRSRSRSRQRAGTTFIAGKRKFSSAFPASGRDSA